MKTLRTGLPYGLKATSLGKARMKIFNLMRMVSILNGMDQHSFADVPKLARRPGRLCTNSKMSKRTLYFPLYAYKVQLIDFEEEDL